MNEPTDYLQLRCPKCGSIMTLRATSRGGLTRYQLRCESCYR